MGKFVCFGEIMGRLAPEGFLRFSQALPGNIEFSFAGAEAIVTATGKGIKVSCDLNFRKNLWKWDKILKRQSPSRLPPPAWLIRSVETSTSYREARPRHL